MNGASNKITKPAVPGTIMPRRITPPPAGGSKPKVPGTPMPRVGPPGPLGSKPKVLGTPMSGPKRPTTPPDRSFDITRIPGITKL